LIAERGVFVSFAHSDSAPDNSNGLLGAQPGRPKFDVLSQLGLARTSCARLPVALPRCAGSCWPSLHMSFRQGNKNTYAKFNNVKSPWFTQGRKFSRYHPILPAPKGRASFKVREHSRYPKQITVLNRSSLSGRQSSFQPTAPEPCSTRSPRRAFTCPRSLYGSPGFTLSPSSLLQPLNLLWKITL